MKSELQRGPDTEPGEKSDRFGLGIESVGTMLKLKERLAVLSDRRANLRDTGRGVAEAREKYVGTMRALELMMGGYERHFIDLSDMLMLKKEGVIAGTPDLLRLTSRYHDEPEQYEYLPIDDALSAEIARMQKLPKGSLQRLCDMGCTKTLFGMLDEYPLDRDADNMGSVDLVKWRSVKELNAKS